LNQYVRDKQPPELIEATRKQFEVYENGNGNGAELDAFIEAVGNIGEINTGIGLDRVSDMKSMYRNTLFMFNNKIVSACESMSASLEAGDIKTFSIHVHSMKSLLATIGARELSEQAGFLEIVSKHKQIHRSAELFPAFKKRLLSLHKQLSLLFPDTQILIKKESGTKKDLKAGIKKALKASENFDSDEAIEIIKGLQNFDFGEESNAVLKHAIEAFEDFDFDNAVKILKKG
jgi:HPt (histidine-containing phosphotransfer) domain-containing protein